MAERRKVEDMLEYPHCGCEVCDGTRYLPSVDAYALESDRDRLLAENAKLREALAEFEIEECPRCNGSGHEAKPNDADACHRCAGAGEILRGGWPGHVRAALAP